MLVQSQSNAPVALSVTVTIPRWFELLPVIVCVLFPLIRIQISKLDENS